MRGYNVTREGYWEGMMLHFKVLECHVKSLDFILLLFNMHMNHLGFLLNSDFDSVNLRWSQRGYISNKTLRSGGLVNT